jgi:hypothetical protein
MVSVSERGVSPFLSDFRLIVVALDPTLSIRAAVGGSAPHFCCQTALIPPDNAQRRADRRWRDAARRRASTVAI